MIPRLPLAGVDVVDVDDDSVDLRWRMVDIPAFGYDEKPLAYLIEAQQLPRYDWVPVASGISDTKYKVKNLQRNQDYVFRIRGEFPSGLSQPSQHISVFRRPSESQFLTSYIPYRSASSNRSTPKSAPIVARPSQNVAPISTNNLRSKQQKFLDNIQQLDKRKSALLQQVKKFEEGLKNFGKVDLPPLSPRSRRDKFMTEQKKPRVAKTEKKADFMSTLDKFRRFEPKPMPKSTYNSMSSSMVDLTSIRGSSVDYRPYSRTPSRSTPTRGTPSREISTPKPIRPYQRSASDLYRPRPSSYTLDDIALRTRINDIQFRRRESPSPMPRHTASSNSVSSRFRDRRMYSKRESSIPMQGKQERKPSPPKMEEVSRRSSSWHGESMSKEKSPLRSEIKEDRSRSESRHGSLSLIGQSVYHDTASRSSSITQRRSVSRAPSLPPIGVSANISSTMSKFMQSVNRNQSYDRRGSLTDLSSLPRRSYSVSTDIKFHKPGVDTRSAFSSRSRSRSVTGSAGRSASAKYQRSTSPGLIDLPMGSTYRHASRMRSLSAASGSSVPIPEESRLTRPRRSSVLSTDSLPKPKKNVSYTSYVPKTKCFRDATPVSRSTTPAPSLTKTPPSTRKFSPSRATPARTISPPRSKASSPAPSDTVYIVRERASSISSAGSGHHLPPRMRTSSISSSGSSRNPMVPGGRHRASSLSSAGSSRGYLPKPSEVMERDKPAWIKSIVGRFKKHLA